MEKIFKANSEFFEDIVKLALIYQHEDNVDFEMVKSMYNHFYDNYKSSAMHYYSCAELHRMFKDDAVELAKQIQLHEEAADAYGFKFITDPKVNGYTTCNASHFNKINQANSQTAHRARAHLITFTLGAFRMPEMWKLVDSILSKKKNDLTVSSLVGSHNDNIGLTASQVLSDANLRNTIFECANKTAQHINRFHSEAWDAYTHGKGRSPEVCLFLIFHHAIQVNCCLWFFSNF